MKYMGCVAAWWCQCNAPSTVWLQGYGCRGEDLDMRSPKNIIYIYIIIAIYYKKNVNSMCFPYGAVTRSGPMQCVYHVFVKSNTCWLRSVLKD
jgi:hypothetical protein